jgi:type III secretion system FlhB-like substrate exporter
VFSNGKVAEKIIHARKKEAKKAGIVIEKDSLL